MSAHSIPANWAMATIEDIAVPTEQCVPRPDQAFLYIDIGSVDRETKSVVAPQAMLGAEAPSRARKCVRAGDTLVSMTRPNLNAVALVDEKLDGQIASTGFDVLRAPGLDPRWIFYIVRSSRFVDAMTSLVQGALYPAVRSKDVRSFELPVAPLPEQKRIADKLDTLLARVDDCRDRLDRVTPLIKRFRLSVLAAAMSGRLTETWREENPARDQLALSEVQEREQQRIGRLRVRGQSALIDPRLLHDLPKSWAWVENYRLAMDDANAICAGPFGTIFKAKDFRDTGVPIIFLRHVGAGTYLTHKPGFMDPDVWAAVHQPYSVHGGELLVTKLGDPPGTACLYPRDVGTAMVTPDVMKMNVDDVVADARYLMHYFNAPTSKKITEELCFGVTRLRIDLSMFKTFPIPLPPRAEQKEITRRVDQLFAFADRLEDRLAQAKTAVDRLTPALLAKAFRGELVPQDPNDEPAAELLKRLHSGHVRVAKGEKAPRSRRLPVTSNSQVEEDATA